MNEKYNLLVFSGVTLFSFYYAYDLPGMLNYSLRFKDSTNKEMKIGLLYTAYVLPNIVLPFFISNYAKCKQHKAVFLLSIVALIGQLLFTSGVYLESFAVMIIGRIVFGIGCESFLTFQNKTIAESFKLKEISTAMSIFNICGRLGTIMNFLLTPVIVQYTNATVACSVGCLLICFSARNSYFNHKRHANFGEPEIDQNLGQESERAQDQHEIHQNNSKIESIKASNYALPQSSLIDIKCEIMPENKTMGKSFHPSFKLLAITCFLYAMIWTPYYNIAPMIYQRKYKMTKKSSGRILSLLEIISMISSLITAPVIDKCGMNLSLLIIGALLLGLSHVSVLLSDHSQYTSILLLGISAACFSSTWSYVPRLVAKKYTALAFSILTCATNLAIAASSILFSYVAFKDDSFRSIEISLIGLSLLLFFIVSLLHYQNAKSTNSLDEPE